MKSQAKRQSAVDQVQNRMGFNKGLAAQTGIIKYKSGSAARKADPSVIRIDLRKPPEDRLATRSTGPTPLDGDPVRSTRSFSCPRRDTEKIYAMGRSQSVARNEPKFIIVKPARGRKEEDKSK